MPPMRRKQLQVIYWAKNLCSEFIKNFKDLIIGKNTLNWATDLKIYFSKLDTRMVYKNMKKCSLS